MHCVVWNFTLSNWENCLWALCKLTASFPAMHLPNCYPVLIFYTPSDGSSWILELTSPPPPPNVHRRIIKKSCHCQQLAFELTWAILAPRRMDVHGFRVVNPTARSIGKYKLRAPQGSSGWSKYFHLLRLRMWKGKKACLKVRYFAQCCYLKVAILHYYYRV